MMAFLATLLAFGFALLGLSVKRLFGRPGDPCGGCGGCPGARERRAP